jgi:aryl-alcohol dehydrogenase-like predicted oxidoreductase
MKANNTSNISKLGGRFTFPGTLSVAHLRENLASGQLTLPAQILAELNGIAAEAGPP